MNILPRLRPITHRASALWRHMACPGSADLESRVPLRPPTDPAIEGTWVHKVIDTALTAGIEPCELLGKTLPYTQTDVGGNGYTSEFIVTGEHVEAAAICTDYVNRIMAQHPTAYRYIEQDVSVEYVCYQTEERANMGSTADILILVPGQVLYVIDYKNGRMIVNPVENKQLTQYSIGAISFLSGVFALEDLKYWYPKRMELSIVQPNAFNDYNVDTWLIDDLERFFGPRVIAIKEAIFNAEDKAGQYVIGPQCDWCDGLASCPGVINEALLLAERNEERMYELTPGQLAELLRKAPAIKKLCEKINDIAEKRIVTKGPKAIPGFKRVSETKYYRSWDTKINVGERLTLLGFDEDDLYREKVLHSPAQIDALCKKLKWTDAKETIGALIRKSPKTYYYVVPEDDRRDVVYDAADDFTGHFIGEEWPGRSTKETGGQDVWGSLLD